MKIFFLVFIFLPINGTLPDYEKVDFCKTLECDESDEKKVCGAKYGDEEVIYKLFDNECKLLKYGCQVEDNETYGIINMKYCTTKSTSESENIENVNTCTDCIEEGAPVCGIRRDGAGFKIRTFENECRLNKYNCDGEVQFTITDYFICLYDPKLEEENKKYYQINDEDEFSTTPVVNGTNNTVTRNLVIVDGSMFNPRNINESVRRFFAATHVLDLPMRDIQPMFNESTRRRLVKIFGPLAVYTPWTKVPKNISDDYYHKPTLGSCYHKCPTKCPDTYAPVCGVPGITAREPTLMFQNHCYMDSAQCKMQWEGKSFSSGSSYYIESVFLFCVGDEMHGVFRFLPLIRTLQHMGRLKNKGHFKYKLSNMKFFNNLMSRQPKLMG